MFLGVRHIFVFILVQKKHGVISFSLLVVDSLVAQVLGDWLQLNLLYDIDSGSVKFVVDELLELLLEAVKGDNYASYVVHGSS